MLAGVAGAAGGELRDEGTEDGSVGRTDFFVLRISYCVLRIAYCVAADMSGAMPLRDLR